MKSKLTRKEKYIKHCIAENLHVFLKYIDENPAKALRKFGNDNKQLEHKLVLKYSKQYHDKMVVKRYNRSRSDYTDYYTEYAI